MFEFQTNVKETEYGIIIDDFYRSPYKVRELLLTLDPSPHKHDATPSYNGRYFKDMRHTLYSQHVIPIYKFLSQWSRQPPLGQNGERRISTNVFRMKRSSFHTPDTHYWWPHFDQGYTAILYLNEEDDTGTNLYLTNKKEEEAKFATEEHYEPWRPKGEYELIHTFEPKFNRLIMFNARKHCHGMNLCSDLFSTGIPRMNQVFFYDGRNQNP